MDSSKDQHSDHGTPVKLVYMANQIARFFSSQGSDAVAATQTAKHILSFWAPSMRQQFLAEFDRGEAGELSPIARAAIEHLRGQS